jgi:hypothetical protein
MNLLIKCSAGPKFLYQFEFAAEGRPSAELHELSLISTLRLAFLLHIPEVPCSNLYRGLRIGPSRKMRQCHLKYS